MDIDQTPTIETLRDERALSIAEGIVWDKTADRAEPLTKEQITQAARAILAHEKWGKIIRDEVARQFNSEVELGTLIDEDFQ